VAAPDLFSDEEIRFLEELAIEKVDFMIVGLSAAALQGAPVVTQDIDLWIGHLDDAGFRRAIQKVGGAYVPSIGLNPPMLAGNAVRLFDLVLTMHGLDSFEDEAANAQRIKIGSRMVNVLPLDRIIHSKRTVNRPKDQMVIPILEDSLKIIRSRKSKK
jgi:hypothetical protein